MQVVRLIDGTCNMGAYARSVLLRSPGAYLALEGLVGIQSGTLPSELLNHSLRNCSKEISYMIQGNP